MINLITKKSPLAMVIALTVWLNHAMSSLAAAPQQVSPQERIKQMEAAFQSLENGLNTIEQKSRITAEFNFDTTVDRAAETSLTAFRASLAAVEQDVRAQRDPSQKPDSEGLKLLRMFEERIQDQRGKADKIIQRVTDINVRVRDGKIVIDQGLLRHATQTERRDLRNWVRPEIFERYIKEDPGLFPQKPLPQKTVPEKPGARLNLQEHQNSQLASNRTLNGWKTLEDCGLLYASMSPISILRSANQWQRLALFEKVSDFLVPRAEAGLALGCYGICASSLGAACAICVLGAGDQAVRAWNTFQSDRRACGSCKWYKPWTCACRAAVLAAFLAKLA